MQARVLLCKQLAMAMPTWRRFYVDVHCNVHILEVPHKEAEAAAASAERPERPARRVSPSRAARSARRAADRAARQRTEQVRQRICGLLRLLLRQWRAKRRADVWAEHMREHLALRDSTPPAPSTALAPLLRNAAAPDEAAAGGKLTEHIQLVPNETFKRLRTPPRAIPPQARSPPSAPHRKKQLLADLDAAADAPLVAASTADCIMAELQQDN